MNQPAIRARGLRRHYGEVVALDGVDLEVAQGVVHGLVGPNGAGKTTLMGLLLGLATPDAGELELLGTRMTGLPGVPTGVSGFVDAPGLYPSLTARQNLEELARLTQPRLGRRERRDRAAEALDQLGLTDVADDRVRGFSLGMRQRLGLASALLATPRLLVLDEPVNGLDPAGRRQVHDVLLRLARRGTAVVVSSHRMDDLQRICSQVTILHRGAVAFDGSPAELAARCAGVDHRLVTTDPRATLRIARQFPDLVARLDEAAEATTDTGTLVVGGPWAHVDALLAHVVASGISVREFAPMVPPLEAAFLALTDDDVLGEPRDAPPRDIAHSGPDPRLAATR